MTSQAPVSTAATSPSPSPSTATPNAESVSQFSSAAATNARVCFHPEGALLILGSNEYIVPREACRLLGKAFVAYGKEPPL